MSNKFKVGDVVKANAPTGWGVMPGETHCIKEVNPNGGSYKVYINEYWHVEGAFDAHDSAKHKCVDNYNPITGDKVALTVGKEYTVWSDSPDSEFFKTVNDKGKVSAYRKSSYFGIKTLNKNTGENKTMTNNNASPFDAIAASVVHGLKVAAAAQSADLMLEAAKKVFGKDNAILATEDGRQLAKFVVAAGLMYATSLENLPVNIPKKELVGKYCGMVVEATARDFVQPKMAQLAEVGTELMDTLGQMAVAAVKSGLASDVDEPVAAPVTTETHIHESVPVPAMVA